jgi:HNH endonuclease
VRDEVVAAHARRDYLFSNYVEVEGPLDTCCWEWQRGKNGKGYGQVWYRGCGYVAHRLSFIVHCGAVPDNLCVLHKCDFRPCCNPEHLWIGSEQDNSDDMIAKGRPSHARGELHPRAVLTNVAVSNIKGLLLRNPWCGLRAELARRHGVSKDVIKDIGSGRRYAHVEPSDEAVMPPLPGPPLLRGRIL